MNGKHDWFAPKRFGYGASYPIAWQGWAVLAGYLALLGLSVLLAGEKPLAIMAIMVPATAVLALVIARTTRGGWRWRWGWRDRD
ncbi:MAG TPA: hypothetical protein VFP53_03220 [Sphingomicrobium sp.]|nr:hypothetical protein [Sphingomicrobium sp.]